MPAKLSDANRAILERMFDFSSREEQDKALQELSQLPAPDQKDVAAYLVQRLAQERDDWIRAWSLSALALLNQPGTSAVVAKRLSRRTERFEWARFWGAIALTKMRPADLEKRLKQATKDESPLVQAVAYRLLVEIGEEQYLDALIQMAEDKDGNLRWVACKALRQSSGAGPLSTAVERRIVPLLAKRLNDRDEWQDVQYQAGCALGDLEHEWQASIDALAVALRTNSRDWVRRVCVEALGQIRRQECKLALREALEDRDAEIRVRAARSLKHILGPQDAVLYLIDELLERDVLPTVYFDALREIDPKAAATALSEKLSHPDPSVADHAADALALLGGHEALRSLHAQRTKALDVYTTLLGDADKQIIGQFDGLMFNAKAAFVLSMCMHGLVFLIGAVVLAIGLWTALAAGVETFERVVGTGAAAGSLATLLALFYKDPLTNIRKSVTGLVKVNIIFLGYIRQINQTDATFKQLFLSSGSFSIEQMKQTVEQIQKSVEQTMDQVKNYMSS